MRGLEQFLAKIRDKPRGTLISRYLALIADIADDEEKATRVLDLAEALVKRRPQECLRLSHMVFLTDRGNRRALDLMIQAMEARGRSGKAEVLRLEKAKLEKELESGSVRQRSAPLPKALFAAVGDDEGEEGDEGGAAVVLPPAPGPRPGKAAADRFGLDDDAARTGLSRIAELDLRSEHDADAAPAEPDVLERLFPSDAPATPAAAAPAQARDGETIISIVSSPAISGVSSRRLGLLAGIPEHKPVDTVLPGGFGVTPPEQLAATLHLAEEPGGQPRAAAPKAAVDPRWLRPEAALRPEAEPMPVEAFWAHTRQELARLERLTPAAPALLVPLSRIDTVRALLMPPAGVGADAAAAAPLPDAMVRRLVELDHREPAALELKWTLLQGLFGHAPDGRLCALLEAMGLSDASPGFFGFYLDGLIRDGRASVALLKVRHMLKAQPRLPWAHAAWRRLPTIWTALGVQGGAWSEDDGVPALLALLARRPQPKLASLIVAAAPAALPKAGNQ